MSKFDKIIPKGSVPNCQLQIANRYDNRWFKCKLKPPKNPVGTDANAAQCHGEITTDVPVITQAANIGIINLKHKHGPSRN